MFRFEGLGFMVEGLGLRAVAAIKLEVRVSGSEQVPFKVMKAVSNAPKP